MTMRALRLDTTTPSRRRHLCKLVLAAVMLGTVPPSALPVFAFGKGGAELVDLAPSFPTPMSLPPTATGHRAPSPAGMDKSLLPAPAQPENICRPGWEARPLAHHGLAVLRNGCAAAAHGRRPEADEAYPHARPAAVDMDSAPTPATLTSGGPPTYASPNWQQLQPSGAPSGRYGLAMAYDAARQQVVAFGGTDGTSFFGDTWTWNGSTWTHLAPASSPSARAWTQMVYDAATQTVVLFGGETTSAAAFGDTWTWNGTTWTQLSPATSPPARSDAAMAYDTQTGQVVLTGGSGWSPGSGSVDLSDTWTFNGTTWTQGPNGPSARSGARAAYDSVNGNVVLFGGVQKSGTFLGDTWIYNGTSWTQAAPSASPSPRADFFFADDGGLPGVVLFGGYTPTTGDVNDTWRWNSSGWALASGIASPSGRDGGAMAFHAPSGQLVQLGGSDGFSNFAQTWVYATGNPTITDSVSANTASRGAVLTYTVVVGNPSSASSMANVAMTDTLPAGLVVAPTSPALTLTDVGTGQPVSCTSCQASGQTVSASGLTMAASDSIRIVFKVVAVGSDRACVQRTDSAVASNGGLSVAPVFVTVTVCDTGLGTQLWWSYVTRTAGPQGGAAVNVANGNLVLTQQDSTVIPDHGQLDFDITRTYNSEETDWGTLPSSIGAGWVLAIGQDKAKSGGVTASGLIVPAVESYANHLPVVLVDGSGTRHLFMPRALSQRVDITSVVTAAAPTSPLGALKPRQLVTDLVTYDHVCVDGAYDAPAGVHLGMWRYIELRAASPSTPCTPASGTTPVVLGFGAERPDRLHFEFASDGHLVDLLDGNGNELRYQYDSAPTPGALLGRLNSVSSAENSRSLAIAYPSSTETRITDPAGRLTDYLFDASGRLTTVVNPDTSRLAYTYGTCTGTTTQLCSTTDPRQNRTSFTYTSSAPAGGPARIGTITDRANTVTTLTYVTSPDYVTADVSAERTQYASIDTTGRVGEIDSGSTANVWNHENFLTWDQPGATCRQPDAVVDNNLCRRVQASLTSTPSEDTSYVYNAEGRVLDEHDAISRTTTRDRTAGYSALYLEASGVFTSYDDGVAGNGQVTSSTGPGAGGGRTDSGTLFALSDIVESLPPRGNAAGAGYAAYLTTYYVDHSSGVNPNQVNASGTCADLSQPGANSGNLCEVAAPSYNGTYATVTRYIYGGHGERTGVITPDAYAQTLPGQTAPQYTLTYYGSGDLDLSGTVTTDGWLKGVTDPLGTFVAMGYDAAGNPTRVWDRNATQGMSLASFPGTLAAPPSSSYTETLHGAGASAYSAPWRYVLSQRDQLGDLTTFTVDANGNDLTTRPPRGNAAGTGAYDTTQTFDGADRLLTKLTPAEAAANKPWQYSHDLYGNVTQTTDPNGTITVHTYDMVNRLVKTKWTRGPYPVDTSTVPSACARSTTLDNPIPPNLIVCSTATSYDGVDNQIALTDGNAQVTTQVFDGIHELIEKLVARGDGTYTNLRTDAVYDLDGHVTDTCPPRQFTEGGSTTCTAQGQYSVHKTYDVLGRAASTTTYRAGVATTTAYVYDADGNVTQTTDAGGHLSTAQYDLLDRRTSRSVQRDASTWNTTSWLYDASGAVTAEQMPGNRTTDYSYDVAHRLVDTVKGADNPVAASAGLVDASGSRNIRSRIAYDPDGHVIAAYDPRAFMTSTTVPDARFMVRTEYDADGRPVALYVPRYDSGSYSDASSGTSTTQGGQCSVANGPSSAPTYPNGVGVCVTRAEYDYNGNRTKLWLPTSNRADNRFYLYTYTQDNLLYQVEAPNPAAPGGRVYAQTTVYDADDQPVRRTDADGVQHTITYTRDELPSQATDTPNGALTHVTSFSYDANGNRVRVTDAMGNTSTSAYYSDNKLATTADAMSDVTSYTYDPLGNVLSVSSPAANAHDAANTSGTPTVNSYTYDDLLQTILVPVSPDGRLRRQTAYSYDAAGRKIGQHVTMVQVPGPGQQTQVSDGGSQTFAYFPDDRMSSRTGRDGSNVTYTYDAAGNTTSVHDTTSGGSTISSTFYLDERPRTVDDTGRTTAYGYDGAGAASARILTVDGGNDTESTLYTYGDAALPSSMASGMAYSPPTNSSTTSWTYDPAGHVLTEADPNGGSQTRQYNADATLSSLTVRDRNQSVIATWGYTYDQDYRQTSASFSGNGAVTGTGTASPVLGTFNYAYDKAGRITTYQEALAGSAVVNETVGWDHSGDRTDLNTSHWTYNADGSIASVATAAAVTQANSYYPFGGLQSDGCDTYTYDGFDRLITVQQQAGQNCPLPSSTPTTYTYDGLDRQRSRNDSNGLVAFHEDGLSQNVVVETKSGKDTDYVLSADGQRKSLMVTGSSPPTRQYLADDGTGNITTVVDTNGVTIDCTARFDAFGVAQGALSPTNPCNTGSTFDNFFYRGGRQDATTGDYTFGSRTYNPSTGTFTEPDSYRDASSAAALALATDPLTENAFSYAAGDPVNFWDPTGHNPCSSEGYDDSGVNGCTASENQNLAAGSAPGSTGGSAYSSSTHGSSSSYGTHPTSGDAPSTSHARPSTALSTESKDTRDDDAEYAAFEAELAAERSAQRAYAVWIRHALDANGVERVVSFGAGTDFGVSYDMLTGRCITCNDKRKVDGNTFAWNGRTWDCSPRAHGSSCDESHTYAWNGKEVVEYDDGLKSGGFWFQAGQWIWDHKVDIGMMALTFVPVAGVLADGALIARAGELLGDAVNAVRGVDEGLSVAEAADSVGVEGSFVVGRSGEPIDIAPGTNAPTEINGTQYTGHALDQVQGRGIPPSVVQNTIEHGVATAGRGGASVIYDSVNNVTVVMSSDGRVITVYGG